MTIETEECDIEFDIFPETDKIKNISESKNKTVILIKNLKNCKPFIAVSVLFLCLTIIFIGIMTYFCLKLKNNVLHY